ncbi:MAG TPA: dipeptidase [Tepidisphaeraceae bacterium]|nr:dipeptidase [Tepidisphaeraceae bacterium]
MIDQVLRAIDARRKESLHGLTELLRIPSVSTQPQHAEDMVRCARSLSDTLGAAGLSAAVRPTGGHPAVVARNEHRPGRPTVLFYGHYDVQPAEPFELWATPPFEPSVRDDGTGHQAVYARGAADDKGQVWCHVEAVRAWQQHGGLPVNLTMLVEGEEESGSTNLERFVREHRDELKAGVCVISDTNQFARGVPAITYGLRGLVYCEVFLTGPSHDLHSGMFGGSVPNPGNALCELLATLHTPDGRVNVDGFYDGVRALSEQERQAWRKLPFDEQKALRDLGLTELQGEAGYSTLERRWARPTCDINGITSGYQGHGAKTIIPSKASAKVSMRLVPDQDPARIVELFERTLRQRCPKGLKIEFARHGGGGAVIVPPDSVAMRLAAEAVQAGFGKPPTLVREGGSIPVVALMKSVLGIDTLLVGFGLPDDRVHSPNEKFDLDALHSGTRTAAVLYEKLARLPLQQ